MIHPIFGVAGVSISISKAAGYTLLLSGGAAEMTITLIAVGRQNAGAGKLQIQSGGHAEWEGCPQKGIITTLAVLSAVIIHGVRRR